MHKSYTSLAVCLSVLKVHDDNRHTPEEIYQILCLNFIDIDQNLAEMIWNDLHAQVPDWIPWLSEGRSQTHDGGVLWLIEYMKEGGLSRGPLPKHNFNFDGLSKTLAGLIGLSRRWAVGRGLSTKRSFTRTRERDRHGYFLDREGHPWYDHPGNSGY